jgi:hypothetical protein
VKLILNPKWKELRQLSDKDSNEVDPENLKSVLYYDDLPEHFTERAKELFPVVKTLYPFISLKDWINGFKYKLYPERELAKWEDEVKQYLDETGRKKVSPKISEGIWDRVLNKMNKENYLEDLLRENGIEFEEEEEDSFEKGDEPDNLYLANG